MKLHNELPNLCKSSRQLTTSHSINTLQSEILEIESMLNENNQKQKKLVSIVDNLRKSRRINQKEQRPSFTAIDSISALNIVKQLGFQLTSENQPYECDSFTNRPFDINTNMIPSLPYDNENQNKPDGDDDDCCSDVPSTITNSTCTDECSTQSTLLQQQGKLNNTNNEPCSSISNPCRYNNLLDRIQRLEQHLTEPCRLCQERYVSTHDSPSPSIPLNYNNHAQTHSKDHLSILDHSHQTTFIDSPYHFSRISLPDLSNSFQILSPDIQTQSNIHLKQPIIMQGHISNQPVTILNISAVELITTLKNLRIERESLNKSYKNILELLSDRDNQLTEMNSILTEYHEQLQTIERLKHIEDISHDQNWDDVYKFISQIKSRSLFMSKLTSPKDLNLNENIKRLYDMLNTSSPSHLSPASHINETAEKEPKIIKNETKKRKKERIN